ncbi:MAG TPA: hypothetical protein VK961_18840 [Chthoniobacter sp.]|nr:hypothetical protein [Chthoniobacter sp.]
MSVIEARWRKRQSRYEDGIYFGTDDLVELCGTPSEGYRADVRAPVAMLLQSAPDGWTDLDETCSARVGEYQLFAGSTSWEGAGFVAVEQQSTERLLWLLHLAEAEPFTEISAHGDTIHAVSGEYPFRCEWHIPLHSPESFTVTRVRIT